MRISNWRTSIIFLVLIFQKALSSMNYIGQETECDQQLNEILIKQGISPNCNATDGTLIVDGNSTSLTLSLEFKNITSQKSRIQISNFKELSFQNVIFEKFENNLDQQSKFLIILNNDKVTFENIQIIGEQETNIAYLLIKNNNEVQLNNVNITFLNGYTPNSKGPFSQIQYSIQLKQNIKTTIQSYSFLYNQSDKGLKECNQIIYGVACVDDISFEKIQIEINFMKYIKNYPNSCIIQPIGLSSAVEGETNTFYIEKIHFKLNSLPNFFGFLEEKLFLINEKSGQIRNAQINNNNSIICLFFIVNSKVTIDNFNLVNSRIGDHSSISKTSMNQMILPQQTDLTISRLNILNSTVFQQCLIGNLYKLSHLRINFYIENSYWQNTMFYFHDLLSELNLSISSKGSNFEGQFPLFYLVGDCTISSLNLELADFVYTQNGLIYIEPSPLNIFGGSIISLNNLTIITQKNTQLDLQKSGLIKILKSQQITISDGNFINQNNQIFNSQIGGIFSIIDGEAVYFNNITASGFKITGSGSFAFVQSKKIQISNSYFDNFFSYGSGGTFMLSVDDLNITNTVISNSVSNLFGGGIYTCGNIDILKTFQNVTFKNCRSQVGGALAINHYESVIEQITFDNNKAYIYDDDVSLPLQDIHTLSFGEYNPKLINKLQIINKNFSQFNNNLQHYIVLNNTEIDIIYYLSFLLDMGNKNISYSQLNCELPQSQLSFNLNLDDSDLDKNKCTETSSNNKFEPKYKSLKKQQLGCQNNIQFLLLNNFQTLSLCQVNTKQQVNCFDQYQPNNLIEKINMPNQTDFYILFQNQDFSSDFISFKYQMHGLGIEIQMHKQKECAKGQIRINRKGISFCKYCNNFQVSNYQNQTECYTCNPSIFKNCSGYIAELLPGYYIPSRNSQNNITEQNKNQINNFNNSNIITYEDYDQKQNYLNLKTSFVKQQQQQQQDNQNQLNEIAFPCLPQYCQGGDKYGDDLCTESHVGPLCLSCDRKGIQWNKHYTQSNSYECSLCNSYSFNLTLTILFVFMVLIFIFILDIVQLLSYKSLKEKTHIKYRLSTGVYLKIILFFFQITNICSYYQSPNLIKFLFTFQVYAFNPISNSYTNFFECFLIQSKLDWFSSAYTLLIIQTFSPFILILIYLLLRWIIVFGYQKYQNKQQKKLLLMNEENSQQTQQNDMEQVIQISEDQQHLNQQLVQDDNKCQSKISYNQIYFTDRNFIYQLFFNTINSFSMQIISQLLSGVFCENFGETIGSYSILDLTIQCQDPLRLNVRNFLIIPMLVIYSLLVPGFLLSQLIYFRRNLEDDDVQNKFGFLYSVYQHKYYYWEFIKYVIKVLLFICIYLLIPNNSMIGSYVLTILVIYSAMAIYFQPFLIDDEDQKQQLVKEQKYGIGHTFIEIIMIISGLVMILCFMINDTYVQSKYSKLSDSSSKIIAFIGTFQAFVVFMILAYKFCWYFMIRKILQKFQKSKQSGDQENTEPEQQN